MYRKDVSHLHASLPSIIPAPSAETILLRKVHAPPTSCLFMYVCLISVACMNIVGGY